MPELDTKIDRTAETLDRLLAALVAAGTPTRWFEAQPQGNRFCFSSALVRNQARSMKLDPGTAPLVF